MHQRRSFVDGEGGGEASNTVACAPAGSRRLHAYTRGVHFWRSVCGGGAATLLHVHQQGVDACMHAQEAFLDQHVRLR